MQLIFALAFLSLWFRWWPSFACTEYERRGFRWLVTDRKQCARLAAQSQLGLKQIACIAESHYEPHESHLRASLFVWFPPGGSAMRLIKKTFSLSAGVVLMLLDGAAWICSRAMPKCIHGENSYSFPRTIDGKTTRTCCRCGHRREYDMTTMRFLTGHFVSTS